jgi:hypothetical protein
LSGAAGAVPRRADRRNKGRQAALFGASDGLTFAPPIERSAQVGLKFAKSLSDNPRNDPRVQRQRESWSGSPADAAAGSAPLECDAGAVPGILLN